ncbi:MAG: hypothetical protein HQL82_09195 [Magnetococcales bacterium]|nr:hypothetical protein [Magnetococcales bacterium]
MNARHFIQVLSRVLAQAGSCRAEPRAFGVGKWLFLGIGMALAYGLSAQGSQADDGAPVAGSRWDGAYLLDADPGVGGGGLRHSGEDEEFSIGNSLRKAVHAAAGTRIRNDDPALQMQDPDVSVGTMLIRQEAQAVNRDQARNLLAQPLASARSVLREDALRYAREEGRKYKFVEALGDQVESMGLNLLPEVSQVRTSFRETTGVDVNWNPLRPTRAEFQAQPLKNVTSLAPSVRNLNLNYDISHKGSELEANWSHKSLELAGGVKSGGEDSGGLARAAYAITDGVRAEAQTTNRSSTFLINFSGRF